MKKLLITIIIVIAVVAAVSFIRGSVYWLLNYRSDDSGVQDNMIRVEEPKPYDVVSSPLKIKGEARGNWYFEASFPIRIIDANGKELGIVPAQAQGEWMTTEFVPFETELFFSNPTTDTGTLILEKDNPSGLSEHADERRIPVRFK